MKKTRIILNSLLTTCFLSSTLAYSTLSNQEEYLYLDNLALECKTDKSSAFHDYMEVYADYFAPLKDQPITFLEIGISFGNSVKMWDRYFTKANLHFIDNTTSQIKYFSPTAHYHYLDQENIQVLSEFARSIPSGFDVIIDDGGHTMSQQKNSFIALFPHVKSGGLYIIEDLHTSYWKDFFGGSGNLLKSGPGTAVGFFTDLVDDLNYTGALTTSASFRRLSEEEKSKLTDYQKNIYSISFYKSMCFIRKR